MGADGSSMKAVLHRRYGPPTLLEIEQVDRPELTDGGVLVRIHATSVNPVEWHMIRASLLIARLGAGLRRPKSAACGVDYAGTVEAVGKDVTRFKPGDEVFGARTGAFAEYVNAREDRAIVPKPPNVTFEQAASVPVAALTALQGLRDEGEARDGAEGVDQRRLGRGRHVRRPDREGARRGGDRGLQHAKRRHSHAGSAPTK